MTASDARRAALVTVAVHALLAGHRHAATCRKLSSGKAAVSAAYGQNQRRYQYPEAPRTGHPGEVPYAHDRYRGPSRGGLGRQTLSAVQLDSS